ncbi:hypothetical protein [Propionivibrio sp.]|uniref:hypothetical protein n=1 Tax=Propionivibrio sp. TaxID=2212460 RepID=UPI003BF3409D
MISRTLSRMVFLMASGFLLSACGSQLSIENYNKLQTGQAYEEVRQIIGEPTRCDEMLGVRSCTWGDEKRAINVSFVGGKVLLMSATNLK